MRRIIRITLGTVFVVLGFLGLFLPILQGWLFLALGALFLSIDLPIFDRMVLWIEDRFPRLRNKVEKIRSFLKGSEERQKTGK
ncbi:MAG: hypothetical protein QME75_04035 [Deltaproteobacteria bacterium]|nr:hypothetical protein [Deltaproteobacteria bacterium]